MASSVDLGYYVGYAIGCTLTVLGRALSATLGAPLASAELVLQTQDADPSVVASGATGRLALSVEGLATWLRQRGLVGVCRMVPFDTLLPRPDMNLPGVVVLLAPGYPLSTLRTLLACDVLPSARTWTKQLRAFVTHADVYHALLHVRLVDWWAGYVTSVVGTFLYRCTYFGSYLWLQQTEYARTGQTQLFLASQASILAATLMQYPFQVVSARLQAQAALDPSERIYRGAWDCVAKTWRASGPLGFYDGVSLRLLSMVGSAAIVLAYSYVTGGGKGGDGAPSETTEATAPGDDGDGDDVGGGGGGDVAVSGDSTTGTGGMEEAAAKSVDRDWQRQRIQAALAKARGELKS